MSARPPRERTLLALYAGFIVATGLCGLAPPPSSPRHAAGPRVRPEHGRGPRGRGNI